MMNKRKNKELELLRKRDNSILILNLAGVIFIELDLDGIVTFVNKKACQVFGYQYSEMVGKNWFEYFLPKKVREELLPISKKILSGEIESNEYYENLILTKTGEEKLISWHNAIIRNEDNEIIGHLSSGQDISEQKRNEQKMLYKNQELLTIEEELRATNEELVATSDALKQSNEYLLEAKERAEESDRLKSEFLNNMSHEVRTPMNGILGFSSFLAKPNLTDEKRSQFLEIIQTSGNQLLHIIDDILEISKLGAKQVRVFEKEVCLNDLMLDLFSKSDIKAKEKKTPLYLKRELSNKDSTILIDEDKIAKALCNLLENALKFTNEGFIEFGYRLVEGNRVISSTSNRFLKSQNNLLLEIYIKDTGIGINLDKQELIFKKFSQEEKKLTRNVGGLGLGLSIAKENVDLLGGEITLKSKKGKGSTFFVTIPYKPIYSDSDFQQSLDEEKKVKPLCEILIAEDEEVNYLYLETLLLDELNFNCKILHAKNGAEAVSICKNNENLKLVLMDLKMPIMNGYEASSAIRKFRTNLPIIAQTAYTTEEDKQKAFAAGCNEFVSKPTKEDVLELILNKYL